METFVPLPADLPDEPLDFCLSDLDIPAGYQEHQPFLLGLVLDISRQHHANTWRFLDIIKGQLVAAIRSLEDSEDRIYLYHPDYPDKPRRRGEVIAQLMNYSSPPLFSDLEAIRITLAVLAVRNYGKKMVYITDRNSGRNLSALELLLRRHKDGCYLVGIGNNYNPILANLPMTFSHLDDPYELAEKLREILHGKS